MKPCLMLMSIICLWHAYGLSVTSLPAPPEDESIGLLLTNPPPSTSSPRLNETLNSRRGESAKGFVVYNNALVPYLNLTRQLHNNLLSQYEWAYHHRHFQMIKAHLKKLKPTSINSFQGLINSTELLFLGWIDAQEDGASDLVRIFTRPRQFFDQFNHPLQTAEAILNDTIKAYGKNWYYGTGYLVGTWIYTPMTPFIIFPSPQVLQVLSNFISCYNCPASVGDSD